MSIVKYAHHFAKTHKDVTNISELKEEEGSFKFTIDVKVSLPAIYKAAGVTDKGVKSTEKVTLVFPDNFPTKAPKIYLRDDFNKDFAHINPIKEAVNPCVYEGSMDELLQEPKWITALIDQVVDWLQKAASDSMINESQGWEPIRIDDIEMGDVLFVREKHIQSLLNSVVAHCDVYYKQDENGYISVDAVNQCTEPYIKSTLIAASSSNTSLNYTPLNVNNYGELLTFARANKIEYITPRVKELFPIFLENTTGYFFVSLNISRPYPLIGEKDKKEILFFVVEVKEHLNTKTPDLSSKVIVLKNRYASDSSLLRRFSGVPFTTSHNSNTRGIVQLGCGSLGSKIIMHLGRNGNDHIRLYDSKIFSPNNNARHALFSRNLYSKEILMEIGLSQLGLNDVTGEAKDIIDLNEELTSIEDSIIIDATASSVVFNHLNQLQLQSRVIKTTLFNNATIGVVFIEGEQRSVKLIDLYAFLFYLCTCNEWLAKRLNLSDPSYQVIGQGCGSYTTVCSDATISLHAASMSNIIQNKISDELDDDGELYIGIGENNININWQHFKLSAMEILSVKDHFQDEWEVRVFPGIKEKMKEEFNKACPKETGGVVLGYISMSLKSFVIVDIIVDIAGSQQQTYKYVNGTVGLKDEIKRIEKDSGNKITMLGTWHTHPAGGTPSSTDYTTKAKMLKDRDYVPTVCLLYSEGRIIAF